MSRRYASPLTPAGVAEAVVGLGALSREDRATALGVTADGVHAIPGG
jgi:hypothetical protein